MFEYENNFLALLACILSPKLTTEEALYMLDIIEKPSVYKQNAHYIIKNNETGKVFKLYRGQKIDNISYNSVYVGIKKKKENKLFTVLKHNKPIRKKCKYIMVDKEEREYIGTAEEMSEIAGVSIGGISRNYKNNLEGKESYIAKRYKVIEKII